MRRITLIVFLSIEAMLLISAHGLDLPGLAAKVRPCVLLVIAESGSGTRISTGSGFFISSDGRVVTNHHVIDEAVKITLKSETGATYQVDGIAADDPENDITILQAGAKNVPFLELSSGENIHVGQHIAVIGNPMGLEGTLSDGIISAKRNLGGEKEWLQITAAISPGSSGSPVLDDLGKVIGVATMVLREGQSLNFAVPAERVTDLLKKASAKAKPRSLQDPNSELRADPTMEKYTRVLAARDYIAAAKLARQLVLNHPDNAEAHSSLARALAELNLNDQASAVVATALKLDPDHVSALLLAAELLNFDDKPEAGLKYVTRVLGLEADNVEAWFRYGLLLERTAAFSSDLAKYGFFADLLPSGTVAKSIEAFEHAVALEAQNSKSDLTCDALSHIVDIQTRLGSLPNAIKVQKRLIRACKGPQEKRNEERWERLFSLYRKGIIEFRGIEDSLRSDCQEQLRLLESTNPDFVRRMRKRIPTREEALELRTRGR